MENEPLSITDINIDTAFKVAEANFMRMEKLTYMVAEAKKIIFVKTGLRRSDISFVEDDHYIILRLKQSKTDTEYTKVLIVLTAMGKSTCTVAALKRLFVQNPRLPNVPFFRL